jgi:hypothetical protein
MLNYGKKKYSNSRVVRKNNSERNKKPYPPFKLNGRSLTYLGIVITTNGSFCKNKEKLVSQARKAMYSIFKKSRTLCLPIDIQIEMFATMVKPLYYINVWL